MNPLIDRYYGLIAQDFLSSEELAEIRSRKELNAYEYTAFMDFGGEEVTGNG